MAEKLSKEEKGKINAALLEAGKWTWEKTQARIRALEQSIETLYLKMKDLDAKLESLSEKPGKGK